MAEQTAEKAALRAYNIMARYRAGSITKLKALNEMDTLVSNYFEDETPIPYSLTEKCANG